MTPIQIAAQMLPLIVFIIVDSLFNIVWLSIVSAVVFAVGQLVFFYGKTGRFDWFVLLDVGLIVALGSIAIIFKNDLFFKIKPAIIEAAVIIFLFVLIFSSDRFLLDYFGRMMPKGMVFNPAAIRIMKAMLLWLCGYTLLHIGAVLYTAFYTSRKTWAFVAGPGFYLFFIPVMVVLLVKRFRNRRQSRANSVSMENCQSNKRGVNENR